MTDIVDKLAARFADDRITQPDEVAREAALEIMLLRHVCAKFFKKLPRHSYLSIHEMIIDLSRDAPSMDDLSKKPFEQQDIDKCDHDMISGNGGWFCRKCNHGRWADVGSN